MRLQEQGSTATLSAGCIRAAAPPPCHLLYVHPAPHTPQVYYWNHETQEASWVKPSEHDEELAALSHNLPPSWAAIRDDDDIYVRAVSHVAGLALRHALAAHVHTLPTALLPALQYYNQETGESCWERPADAGPPKSKEAAPAEEPSATAEPAKAMPNAAKARRHSLAKARLRTKRRSSMMLAKLQPGGAGLAMGSLAVVSEADDAAGGSGKSGLLKANVEGKYWRRRCCVLSLETNEIDMTVTPSGTHKGSIPLEGATLLDTPEDVLKTAPTEYILRLRLGVIGAVPGAILKEGDPDAGTGCIVQLAAPTPSDAADWELAIKRAIARASSG